jgi:hypothetical protein
MSLSHSFMLGMRRGMAAAILSLELLNLATRTRHRMGTMQTLMAQPRHTPAIVNTPLQQVAVLSNELSITAIAAQAPRELSGIQRWASSGTNR